MIDKPKTVNDLQEIRIPDIKGVIMNEDPLIFKKDLKSQVIKWFKRERQFLTDRSIDAVSVHLMWMDRLNVTEEDLK